MPEDTLEDTLDRPFPWWRMDSARGDAVMVPTAVDMEPGTRGGRTAVSNGASWFRAVVSSAASWNLAIVAASDNRGPGDVENGGTSPWPKVLGRQRIGGGGSRQHRDPAGRAVSPASDSFGTAGVMSVDPQGPAGRERGDGGGHMAFRSSRGPVIPNCVK